MKLLTYSAKETPQLYELGCYREDSDSVLPLKSLGLSFRDMNDLIEHITPDQLEALRLAKTTEHLIPYREVIRRSPIPFPKQDILCLGVNYADHAEESARYKGGAFVSSKGYAVYFSKRVNEAVPDGAGVPAHEEVTERLDYEAELAVIIGKDASHVKAADAYQYVFGYTILNDVSAREVQTLHKQWYFGKSLDGFTPIGPWIVTADEIATPPVLKIRSYINGELRQNSDTSHLIFPVDQIIEDLTRGMTLKAGTIISTGTPAGVGMGFTPPRFLHPGDEMICEIEKIGRLTNRIVS